MIRAEVTPIYLLLRRNPFIVRFAILQIALRTFAPLREIN